MKYYKVEAKCGHVGMNNYIIKCFYVCAMDGKEAASIVRFFPRVKHHHKDAIRSVKEITVDEYILGKQTNNNDKYFSVKNSSDQRMMCSDINDFVLREEETKKEKKKTHTKSRMREMLFIKETRNDWRYAYE